MRMNSMQVCYVSETTAVVAAAASVVMVLGATIRRED